MGPGNALGRGSYGLETWPKGKGFLPSPTRAASSQQVDLQIAKHPWGQPPGGGIHSREGSRVNISPLFPRYVPDGPPDARGPLEVLVGPFTDFSDFLGRLF